MMRPFGRQAKGCETKKEFVFVQYIDRTVSLDNVNSSQQCVSLR